MAPLSLRLTRATIGGFLLVTVLASAGCRRGDGSSARTRDSAGIRIVEHAGAPATQWHVDSQPRLRIGTADGDEALQFFGVAGAARLSDGRIIVANGGSSELRYFSPAGEHVHTAGRRGSGPGEFRRIVRVIRPPGDSLLIVDPMAGRLSWFDAAGRFARSHPIDRSSRGLTTIRDRLQDGRLIGFRMNVEPVSRAGLHVQTATFLLFSDSGTVLDSIGVFPVIEGHARIIEGGQSMYYWPFHAEGFVGASGGLVVHVWGRSPEVRLLGLDGRIGRIVRLGDRPVEFTGELRDAEGDRIARTRPEASRPAFERDWAALEFPDSLPLFSAMLVDRGGDIWLQEHALGTPAERRWIVVRPDGALLAEVMLPAGLRVLEIGPDYILGIQRDELDVESVVLLGLRRLE